MSSTSAQDSSASSTTPQVTPQPQEITTITSVRRIHKKSHAAPAKSSSQNHADPSTREEDEPLIDTTAALTLRSKKTSRLQRKSQKKQQTSQHSSTSRSASDRSSLHITTTLLTLPPELLLQILQHLLPTDLLRLHCTSRSLSAFLTHHSSTLTRHLLSTRYTHLSRAFWLPYPLSHPTITPQASQTLQHNTWQTKLTLHKAPYTTHIPIFSLREICSCISCLLAWNNLALALDYTYFSRKNLQKREPLPIIPRGKKEEWNEELLSRHREILRKAVLDRDGKGGLIYAAILQRYLDVLVAALTRKISFKGKDGKIHTRRALMEGKDYGITEEDVLSQSDNFLERKGPETFEFPWSRDMYYEIDAYVPARKWIKPAAKRESGEEGDGGDVEGRWWYPDPEKMHANDVAWVVGRFGDVVRQEEARDDEVGDRRAS